MGIFGEASKLTIAGFFVIIASFVLQLIVLPTPYWSYADVSTVKYNSGLWGYCMSAGGTSECKSYDCTESSSYGCTSSFKAAQALEILGFMTMLAAVVLAGLKMFLLKDKSAVRIASILCCFIAGGLTLIGVIVYATEDLVDTSYLHFCFAFCIIAAICSVVAGILLLIGK